MNQVYKVVFNKATGVFVAVAEYARGQGKKSNRSGINRPITSRHFGLATLTAALMAVSGTSLAANVQSGNNAEATGTDAVAIGDSAGAYGNNSVALGAGSGATAINAIGIGIGSSASGDNAVAIGANASSNNSGVAIGENSDSSKNSVAAGSGSSADGDNSVAAGSGSSAGGNNSVAVGSNSSSAKSGVSVGQNSSSKESGVAVGLDSSAAESSVAVGQKSQSQSQTGTALGINTRVLTSGGVALGSDSRSTRNGLDATAVATSDKANFSDNQVYTLDLANESDKTAVANTIIGNRGAVSVGFDAASEDDDRNFTRQIVGVAAGSNDSDAVNVSQLKAVANVASKGINIQTNNDDNTSSNIAPGGSLNFVGGDNVNITQSGSSITIAADTNVNTDGFTPLKDDANNPTGAIKANTETALATSGDIASAINSSGWTATGSEDVLVNPGDNVTFSSLDDTLLITNTGTDFTFDIKTAAISANPDMPGSTLAPDPDGLATAGNVSTAINNAGFNLAGDMGEDNVKLGQTVKYVGSDANIETKVTDNQVGFELADTVTIGDSTTGNPVTINGKAGTVGGLTNTTFDPDVTYTGGQAATQEQLTGAYKDAKTTVKSSDNSINVTDTNKGDGNLAYDITINNQGVVEAAQTPVVYTDADGNKLNKQSDGTFTNTNGDVIEPADVIASMNNGAGETTTPMTLTNIQGNLDGAAPDTTAPTTSGIAPTTVNGNNAATVGDVLNSGFNLQADGEAADFVSAYDTVNLAAGDGLETEVTTDGSTTSVEYSVKTDGKTIGFDDDGNVTALTGNVVPDTNKPGATTTTTPNKLATAGNVSEAINNAGFNIAGNEGTLDNVKLGETVTYKGTDDNIVTKTLDNEVGFSLADTVTIGDNENGNPITVNGNTGTIGGLTNKTFDPNDYTSGQAATEDQLAALAIDSQPDPWMLTANGEDATAVGENDAVDFSNGDDNIEVTKTGNNISVGLADDITVNSVTAGDTSLSVDGINAGGNVITNVAPGKQGTDAVNVDQLKALDDKLENDIDDVEDQANAGVSAAMAMASLPQAYLPGKSMITGGMATYEGEGAVAVGLSKLTDNGRWVFKISGSADTEGNAGGAVGAGMHF